jgi:hypothetical protein
MIAKVHGVAKATVCLHCQQYRVNAISPASSGRPLILSHAERDHLAQCITIGYIERRPWTIAEIKGRIELIYRKSMEANSIRNVLGSDPPVKICRGVPTEESRLAVSPDEIEACFHRLVAIVDGTPTDFVFNVDEMNHQEWGDRDEKRRYVRSEHPCDEVPCPVPQSG